MPLDELRALLSQDKQERTSKFKRAETQYTSQQEAVASKKLSARINPETGKPFTIQDIPENQRAQTIQNMGQEESTLNKVGDAVGSFLGKGFNAIKGGVTSATEEVGKGVDNITQAVTSDSQFQPELGGSFNPSQLGSRSKEQLNAKGIETPDKRTDRNRDRQSAIGGMQLIAGLAQGALSATPVGALGNAAAGEIAPTAVSAALKVYDHLSDGAKDNIKKLAQTTGDFFKKYPEAAKIPELALYALGAKKVAPIGGSEIDNLASDAVAGIKNAKNATAKAATDTLQSAAENSAQKSAQDAISAGGKIVQSDAQDAVKSAKTISSIDTEGVKTYKDLSKKLDENIKNGLSEVDKTYESVPGSTKLAKLVVKDTAEYGGKSTEVSSNHVKDAIKDLYSVYQSSGEPKNAARIKLLLDKAKKEGITAKEINDLSREYGTEFKNKAFKANGDPLTSTSAQSYENTRKGLKTTARQFAPEAQAADERVGNLINTKKLVDDMAEKVNKLQQRIDQRGLVEKIARGLAKVADVVTLGGPKAFITKLFFPSNVGQKTLNSLDLEEQLAKNLKLLKQIDKTPDETLPGMLLKIARGEQPFNPAGTASVPSKDIEHGLGSKYIGNRKKIDQYKKDIINGDVFTPIPVRKTEKGYELVGDGFHRLQAHKELGINKVPVVDYSGIRK